MIAIGVVATANLTRKLFASRLGLLLLTSVFAATTQSPSIAQTLRTLPPLRATPLVTPAGQTDQVAYCDSTVFRSDASIRGIDASPGGRILAVGDHGLILLSTDGGRNWIERASPTGRCLNDVIWLDEKNAVAAGGYYEPITHLSRSTILISRDGGLTWKSTNSENLPRLKKLSLEGGQILALGDWSSATRGQFFASRDGGRNWSSADASDAMGKVRKPPSPSASQLVSLANDIGSTIAVRCTCVVGENGFLAAGDHGVIALTQDRGQSWQITRGKDRRASALVVASHPSQIPWSLIGRETIEHRRRVAVLLTDVEQQDLAPRRIAPFQTPSPNGTLRDWTSEALSTLAASGVDVMQSGLDDPEHVGEIENWIAIHRPSVLVVDDQLPSDTQQMLLSAAVAGGTERVIGYTINDRGKTFLLNTSLLPKSGVLAGDFVQDAFHHIAPEASIPDSVSLSIRYDATGLPQRLESLSTRIQLDRGQSFSEEAPVVSRRRIQVVQARLQQLARFRQLLHASPDMDQQSFRSAFQAVLSQTAAEDRFRLAWSIVSELLRDDRRSTLRTPAMETFCAELADHPASSLLRLHLDAHGASDEYKKLSQKIQSSLSRGLGDPNPGSAQNPGSVQTAEVGFTENELPIRSGVDVAVVSPFQDEESAVVQASSVAPIQIPNLTPASVNFDSRRRSGSVDLLFEMHPLSQIVRRSVERLDGDSGKNSDSEKNDVSANLKHVARSDSNWSPLLRTFGAQVIKAKLAAARPRLDGHFDEPIWQNGRTRINDVSIACAYDDQFVYLAIECPLDLLSDEKTQPTDQHRDFQLDHSDRVLVKLDTDRDLLTSMQLEFSQSGKTRDTIDGDRSWQPTWYLFPRITGRSGKSGQTVKTEIAIHRVDLVDQPITPGEAWFLSPRILAGGKKVGWTAVPQPHRWLRVVFE